MLTSLIPTVYIQISPERLTVRNTKSGVAISEIPEVAIAHDPKTSILGVGTDARSHQTTPSVEITNPFAHPRSLVSDFIVGEQLLKAFLRRVMGNSVFAISPRVVIHPLGDPDGGFTQIEIRALREMAMGAGASKAIVWQGRELNDQELLACQFHSDGQVLMATAIDDSKNSRQRSTIAPSDKPIFLAGRMFGWLCFIVLAAACWHVSAWASALASVAGATFAFMPAERWPSYTLKRKTALLLLSFILVVVLFPVPSPQ